MALFWHRRDLRVADNRGLAAAATDGPVVPAFVLDRDVLGHAAPPRAAFLLDALGALRDAYRDRGGDLLLVRGDPAEELPRLADEHGAGTVVWNTDYSGLADRRDRRVEDALGAAGIGTETHDDALLHEPGSILTNGGEPYQVYSYFERKWADREKDDPAPAPDAVAGVDGGPIPSAGDLGFEAPDADLPDAGPGAARDRLDAFLDGPVYRYAEDRDYPAREGTSRLSVDLKFGTVGIREVWDATVEAVADAPDDEGRESVEEFRSQLAWREFYAHVLHFDPGVVAEDFKEYGSGIEWRDDPEGLRAWKAGETGYPIVDAGMRQLREEAWMHNRVRMIVASFLTKDLLIDWRRGYEHFRERLVDHDPANDSGGWQWAASTGTDAQPYFRIFNPATQGERYDPDGAYVREYVPELRGVATEAIHGWPDLDADRRDELAPGYPEPVVDHAERREVALETFDAARDGD